ncbi:MAG: BsuBI/PstI family type II restriction endonuclease [Flavisolibacter sp.]
MPKPQQLKFSNPDLTDEQKAAIQKKVNESLDILKQLKLERFINHRTALVLLALAGMEPNMSWADAINPLMGITPIIDYIYKHYGVYYAPNSREAVRKYSVVPLIDQFYVIKNPDKIAIPDAGRPVNSQKTVYQVEPQILEVIKVYGQEAWLEALSKRLDLSPSIAEFYNTLHNGQKVPVLIDGAEPLYISPGAHSVLIKGIVEVFRKEFSPNSEVIYIGDTGKKWGVYKEEVFKELELNLDPHGKMPDVILYDREKSWLLLIESVATSGEFDSSRHNIFKTLFKTNKAGLVFVTAFPSLKFAAGFLSKIAWKTEVWTLDNPVHLIHLDGERFLGPY